MYNTDFGYHGNDVVSLKVPTELWNEFENGNVLMNWNFFGDTYNLKENDFVDNKFMFADKDHIAELDFTQDEDEYSRGLCLIDENEEQEFMDYNHWEYHYVREISTVETYVKDNVEYKLIIVCTY